jgi:hypothetical protein
MASREQRIYEEAAALWREIFDEPPPRRVGGAAMLEIITRSLGDISDHRMRSPHLRPSTIVGPHQPKARNADLH